MKALAFLAKLRRRLALMRCRKYGHMYYVGASGYYRGLPQSHCYRCGKGSNGLPDDEPLGKWYD